jgi:hypothetical protein
MTGWRNQEGEWAAAKDEEGGKVLAGRGIIRRLLPLPLPEHYLISLNVDVGSAEAVELHFGLAGGADPNRVRNVLRLGPDEVVLGVRNGDRDELRPSGAASAPAPRAATGSPYRELRVERHRGHWFAYCDGKLVGTLPVRDGERPELRLVTEGGPALFEAVEIRELVAAPGKPTPPAGG